jgi:hypothetical protein
MARKLYLTGLALNMHPCETLAILGADLARTKVPMVCNMFPFWHWLKIPSLDVIEIIGFNHMSFGQLIASK